MLSLLLLFQEFVTTLTPEEKDLLKKLLTGSLDTAKNWLGKQSRTSYHEPAGYLPSWCRRGSFRKMPKDKEEVCCESELCLPKWDFFKSTVFQRELLEVAAEVNHNIYPVEKYNRGDHYRHLQAHMFWIPDVREWQVVVKLPANLIAGQHDALEPINV